MCARSVAASNHRIMIKRTIKCLILSLILAGIAAAIMFFGFGGSIPALNGFIFIFPLTFLIAMLTMHVSSNVPQKKFSIGALIFIVALGILGIWFVAVNIR